MHGRACGCSALDPLAVAAVAALAGRRPNRWSATPRSAASRPRPRATRTCSAADGTRCSTLLAQLHRSTEATALCIVTTSTDYVDPTRRAPAGPLRIGIGGPVGSGKTALVAALCRALRDRAVASAS